MASVVAQVSMNDATAVGNGTTIDFLSAKSFVGALIITNGTVTGGTVSIQISQNGTNWATAQFYPIQTGLSYVFNNVGGAFRFWRGTITTAITGGGSVDVTFMEGH